MKFNYIMQLNQLQTKNGEGTILNYKSNNSLYRHELKFKINSYSKVVFKKKLKLLDEL